MGDSTGRDLHTDTMMDPKKKAAMDYQKGKITAAQYKKIVDEENAPGDSTDDEKE